MCGFSTSLFIYKIYSVDSNVTILLEFRLLIDGYAKIESHEHNKKKRDCETCMIREVFVKFIGNLFIKNVRNRETFYHFLTWPDSMSMALFFFLLSLCIDVFFFVESNHYSNSHSLNEQKCFIKIHRSDFSCLYHWYRFIFKRFIWFEIHDNRLLLFETSYLWIFFVFLYFFSLLFLPYHILFSHAHQL